MGEGGLTSSPFGGAVACSRLLDSRDDALINVRHPKIDKTRQDKTRQCFIWSLIQTYINMIV